MNLKNFNTAAALIFVIMLLIPLFTTDLQNGVVSERENRMLADRPPLSSINHPRTFVKNFNEWFSDHVGFREKFISLYKKIPEKGSQYREGNRTYITGKEGHHFFTGYNHDMTAKFAGEPVFSGEQLQVFAQKLEAVKNYLDKKGIPLIVMFCTDKESVYPEYYSEAIRRGTEPNQLDFITNYLKNNTSVDVFNIRQALVEQKGQYPLYPKGPPGDLGHYNEIGAFFAYRELMKHINIYFPKIVPFSLDDIDMNWDKNGVAGISLKQYPPYKKLDDSFFDDVDVHRPFGWNNESFESTTTDFKNIMFLRDSYTGSDGSFLSKYIIMHFSKTILIHYLNIKNIKQYTETFNPDIIVLETSERTIKLFFDYLNQLNL